MKVENPFEVNNKLYSLTYLEWESKILGIKSGILKSNELSLNMNTSTQSHLSNIIEDARELGFNLVTYKVSADNIDEVNRVISFRGKLIDTELTFCKNFNRNKEIENNFSKDYVYQVNTDIIKIRSEKTKPDMKIYADEFAGLFQMSRFFVDKNIDNEKALSLWSKSIQNSFSGRASYSILAYDIDNPIGFMNIFEEDTNSDIFLIGLKKEYRGKGIAKGMMCYFENSLDSKVNKITVSTQSINYSAQKLYTSLGYRNIMSQYVLHIWL